jgi:hypothetical protein
MKNIKVFIIFPVFQNPEILKKDSSLYSMTNNGIKAKAEWVEFVCPSRADYRNAKIEELSDLIKKLRPDGISIDFIRQFVYWEKVYPGHDPQTIGTACFCDSCLRNFSGKLGIAIPDTCTTTAKKADWITRNHADEWETFRCGLISSMIKELTEKARLADPLIKVNVHIVPWREQDFDRALIRVAAQDLGRIAGYADFISPMCYSQMLKRDADWISDVVADMDKQAHGMVLPSIQVYPEYINQSFSAADFRDCLIAALKPPSRGVVFFSWPLFEKDPERMEEVKKVTDGNNKNL